MSGTQDFYTPRQTDLCIALMGVGSVGAKSSLLQRFLYNRFLEVYDPTIEDEYYADIEADGETSVAKIIGLCFSLSHALFVHHFC